MVTRKAKAQVPYRVLGIDPGGSITGWGLVSKAGNSLRLEDSGVIRTKRGAPFAFRLRQLHEGLSEVLTKLKPDDVAIEAVFHAEHARSALQLGHARGVLILAAAQHDFEPFEYPPTTVKKAVTGDGSADKEQVRKMVALLVKEEVKGPADQSDAVAVAICHAQAGGFAKKLRNLGQKDEKKSLGTKLKRRRG